MYIPNVYTCKCIYKCIYTLQFKSLRSVQFCLHLLCIKAALKKKKSNCFSTVGTVRARANNVPGGANSLGPRPTRPKIKLRFHCQASS